MSNNSCDGSVWNALTGKLELRPKEAFTSKRLGSVSSCSGFSHTWQAVQTCHPSDNERKWGVPVSAGANTWTSSWTPPTFLMGLGEEEFHIEDVDWKPISKLDLFLKLPGNANRHEAKQHDLCYGQYLHNTVTHVCMYGCIASTANSL